MSWKIRFALLLGAVFALGLHAFPAVADGYLPLELPLPGDQQIGLVIYQPTCTSGVAVGIETDNLTTVEFASSCLVIVEPDSTHANITVTANVTDTSVAAERQPHADYIGMADGENLAGIVTEYEQKIHLAGNDVYNQPLEQLTLVPNGDDMPAHYALAYPVHKP